MADRTAPDRAAETGFLPESRKLAALAVPVAVTQLAQVALTTTDTLMMGLISTAALAAGGLAIVLFNQVRTMGVGLVTAVGNQVAAAEAREGPDREEQIGDLVRAGLALGTVAGVLGAAALIGLGQVLVWFGQDPTVVAQAQPLLAALAPGLVPCLWFQVIRQYTVGMRRPQALMWITVASVAVNAGLNWGFIQGTWLLPAWGLTGIGIATSLVYLLLFLALYLMTRRDPVLAPMLSLRTWRARMATVRRLVGLGLPISATYGSEAGFFSVTALIMGSFGASALAAHAVVNQLVYIVFQVTIGLSHAASISVSAAMAVGRIDAAARVGRLALLHGAALMAVVAVVYLVAPGMVLAPFLDAADRTTMAVAAGLLAVAALLQFFDCAQNIGVGLLRGLDDTKAGFRMTLIGYWLVGLPTAALLGQAAGVGPVGVWLGLLSGLAVTAGLLLYRFVAALAARGESAVQSR
jgi:MATE family multidrug resistance protein